MNYQKRLNNIRLLLRVLVRGIIRGPADKSPETVSRIIVVPTGKLGDVVCTTPVLAAVRAHFPKAHLIVGGNSKLHKLILANSKLVDEYLELENNEDAINQIKKCHIDVALLTGPSFELAAPIYLAGVPLITAPEVLGGCSTQATRPYKVLLRFLKKFPYRIGEYVPRERLRCLEPIGIIDDDTKKHLGFSDIADEKVNQFLVDNRIDRMKDFVIGLTPTAGHKIKEWPEDRFAQVADYLTAKYSAKVIIIGGPKDKEKVEKTRSYLNPETKVTEIIDFNIDELKALISMLHLFISVDTGPIYIAEAFDIPTIDITGPIDEKEQPPRGLMHRNVVPPQRLHPELFVLNAKSYNKEEALRQVMSITSPMVKDAADLLIADIKRQR